MGLPLIDTVLDLVKGPLDKLIPDKNKKLEFEHEIHKLALSQGLAQLEINKIEAKHPSIFVAGWRPFIGWVCGMALLWHFMLHDIVVWSVAVYFPDAPPPPTLVGTETLITVLLSLLGLGGLRTFEKVKGISRNTI